MYIHKFVVPLLIGIISLSSSIIIPVSVYAQVALSPNDLQTQWKLDEGNGATVSDSIQGSNGSFVNALMWVPGKMGTALDFKQDGWVKIAGQSAINNMNSFTVTAWVYVRAGGKRIITKGDTRPVRYYLAAPQRGQYLDFGAGYDGALGEWQTATGTLPSNGWHQVAVSYAFGITSQPSLYIDGIPQPALLISAPKGNPEPDTTNTYLGGRGDGVANFDGMIDEVRIYGHALTASEVQAQYQANVNDIQAEWKLDEGKGNVVSDLIQGSNGAFVNTPTWATGKMGGALDFKQDSWVKITGKSAINNMTNFTVVSWVYARAGGSRIFTKGDTRPVHYYLAIPHGGQYLDFGAGYDSMLGEWQTATGTLPSNEWHQVAVSYAFGLTSKPSIYIDGIPQTAIVLSSPKGNPEPDSTNTYLGGRGDGVANFDGMIDNTRIYGHALTAAEIRAQYLVDASAVNPTRPNIVVIMSDDQDDQGSLDVMTQVKALILNQGVRFTNSFVVNPLCCSSRASFLTGQYSHNNGVWQNARNGNGFDGGYGALAPTAANTLPVWMQKAGYKTGLIGKYLNQYGTDVPATSVPPGWDTWNGLVDPSTYTYYNYTINENGTLHTYGSTVADYQTDVLTSKALSFINASAASSQSFFLWLTPLAPHAAAPDYNTPVPSPKYAGVYSKLPLLVPPSFNEGDISDKPSFMQKVPLMGNSLIALTIDSYRKRREALLSVDDMVAQVIATLKANGKLDNTYIIYTSDNGFFQGQHRLPIEKRLGYEEAIRVPLAIRGPGVASGQTRDSIVSNLDLPATILDIAQAAPGRSLDGHSLLPLLGINPSGVWRSDLLIEGTDKIPFDTTFYSSYAGVRTKQFAYIEHKSLTGVIEKELYDLTIDPYELQNKQNDPKYATIVKQLGTELSWLHSCQGVTCWVTTPAVAFKNVPLPMFAAAAIAEDTMVPADIGAPNPIDTPVPAEPGDLEESALTPMQRDQFYVQDKNPLPVRGVDVSGASVTPVSVVPAITLTPVPTSGFVFSTTMQLGMSGSDITKLQALLAQDPSLYPEGRITGYFGGLTKQAVIRFQEKYADQILVPAGLTRGTGFVGQATLRQLNMSVNQ